MGKSVTLHKQTSKGHAYWVIRWMASDGRRPGKNLGRVDTISKRQAEKMRRQKEIELETHPGSVMSGAAPSWRSSLNATMPTERPNSDPARWNSISRRDVI